jgi:predicted dehydrogenase
MADALRIALVGCGQIADAHLHEIRKIHGAQLVAVCDRLPDLAEQAALRFDVPHRFDELGRMLADAHPHVLHVTTPPAAHGPIALQALAAGIHVYLEKPFALDVAEADEVIEAARSAGRLVCVGHDQLFDPVWEECRELYSRGALGEVIHVESVQGYDLAGAFGRCLTADPDHWVRRLPGGLFHNTISHAVCKIADFLPDERPTVRAEWFGGARWGFPTELRASLRGAAASASLFVSAAAAPVQRVARIYATRGTVEVDFDTRLVRQAHQSRLPGCLAKIEGPYRQWREAAGGLRRNLARFARNELHYFAGMGRLFRVFYRAIREGRGPPIPYSDVRRVTWIMDEVFRSCHEGTGDRSIGLPRNALGRAAA